MMANTRTRVATVDTAFSSSKNVALIECKMLQCTTFSIKTPPMYIQRNKNSSFSLSDIIACLSILWVDQKKTLKPTFYRNLIMLLCKHVLTEQVGTCRRSIKAQAVENHLLYCASI